MIGTDIEYPVYTGDILDAGCGRLGGDKHNPRWFSTGNIQEDNILAEIAINPAQNEQEFVSNISTLQADLKAVLEEQGCVYRHEVCVQPSMELLQDCGTQALTSGCDPEYSAYTGERLPAPDMGALLRTGSGHVHYSYPNPTEYTTALIAQLMDLKLGTWSVLSCPDNLRRTMYGKAGAIRFKEYGGEYRTLSNSWTYHDTTMRKVYQDTEWCIANLEQLPYLRSLYSEELVQHCINNYDHAVAYQIQATMEAL